MKTASACAMRVEFMSACTGGSGRFDPLRTWLSAGVEAALF
ncbi:hypothetical protein CcCBS67573_g04928 [Chytriomyces confervae]|uniref:Uncharacterized protein n=1 Tax=Chytriomyces confervae TaxID=246404 RepID=A0A507FC73_9FUNG|nr:hypothetical protein CcCBS67573_g04928 [Chytriomyces confervae]